MTIKIVFKKVSWHHLVYVLAIIFYLLSGSSWRVAAPELPEREACRCECQSTASPPQAAKKSKAHKAKRGVNRLTRRCRH